MAGVLKNIQTIFYGLEQAPYTVVKEHEKYEERHYPARKWASIQLKSINRDEVQETGNPMYNLLFNYISGGNQQDLTIDMTSPMITHVETGVGPNGESSYSMSFLIPDLHQENPPTPLEPVYITERPAMNVLARRFGGYVNKQVLTDESNALAVDIQRNGEDDVDIEQYYVAEYDVPLKIIFRRNEIWFLKNITDEIENKENFVNDQIDVNITEKLDNASNNQ